MGRYCPSSYTATLQRIQSLGCDQRYRYHCMRNKKDEMVEKCIEISWIQEGKCAVYDTDAQLIDSWKCNGTRGVCPQKQYLSNEVMSYSACVPLHMPTNVTDGINENTSKIPNDGSRFDNNNSSSLPLIVGAILALIAVISVIVITVIYIRRTRTSRRRTSEATKRQKKENMLSDPEEGISLTIGTDVSEKHDSTIEETRHVSEPYYKTRTYEYVEKQLEESAASIVIIGNPGIGKSVLAKMLHNNFRGKKVKGSFYDSRQLKRLEDVDSYTCHDGVKMIYIIDDCFEDWNQYPHLVTTALAQFNKVHEEIVKGKGNSVVITISKWNFDKNLDVIQKARLKQCDKLQLIDLSEKEFKLDITDKSGILEFHRKRRESTTQRLDNDELRRVIAPGIVQSILYYVSEPYLEFEFPLSCRLFYSHESFVAQKEKFFNETKKEVGEYVRALSKGSSEEKSQYCTLIYMALCGGKVQDQKNPNLLFLETIASTRGIELEEKMFNFGCCLVQKGNDDTYKIVHEEITKLLFTSFGLFRPVFVIDNCDIEVLLKFMRTDDRKRRDEYYNSGHLVLLSNLYHRLAKRLHKIDRAKQMHIIFKDECFERIFRTIVKNRNQKM